MHITQRIHRSYRLGRAFRLLLVQLHFICLQAAIALVNIHIARKRGVVRISTLRTVCSNGYRQAICITLHQWAIITWNAKHTLRGEIGRQPLLTVQGGANHCGQKGGDTFFHTLYFIVPSSVATAYKRSETILLISAVPALILPVCVPEC